MDYDDFPLDMTPTEEEMERWATLEAEVDIYAATDRYMYPAN